MDKFLEGIKTSNNSILEEIYQIHFPIVSKYITTNNGDEAQAKDIFQEALIALYRRLQKEDIDIKVPFGAYLYGTCRFIWLKKITRSKTTESIEQLQIEDTNEIETAVINEQKYTLFQKKLNLLGEDCKKVLNYYFEGMSFKDIAKLMKYTSEEYARRRKYLCKKNLMKKIKQDPSFRDLYNT